MNSILFLLCCQESDNLVVKESENLLNFLGWPAGLVVKTPELYCPCLIMPCCDWSCVSLRFGHSSLTTTTTTTTRLSVFSQLMSCLLGLCMEYFFTKFHFFCIGVVCYESGRKRKVLCTLSVISIEF
jgi:hypothetical protein